MSALPILKKVKRQFKRLRVNFNRRLKRYRRAIKKIRTQLNRRAKNFHKWRLKHRRLIALICLIISIQLVLASGWYLLYRRTILSFQAVPVVMADSHQEVPTRLIMPAQQIDLPITPAQIDGSIWQVSDTSALHLATSSYPGERGNIVIYGHNKMNILGKLRQVKIGDTITLLTDLGLPHSYTVREIMEVKPSDIEVVLPTNYEVLTIYTCIGWLDSRRLVVKAYPTMVN